MYRLPDLDIISQTEPSILPHEGAWPEGFAAGPCENPEDENVDMGPDENLPWPNLELINKWWHAHRSEFQPGTRYLLGKPMSLD